MLLERKVITLDNSKAGFVVQSHGETLDIVSFAGYDPSQIKFRGKDDVCRITGFMGAEKDSPTPVYVEAA